jgi:hypothetical protein
MQIRMLAEKDAPKCRHMALSHYKRSHSRDDSLVEDSHLSGDAPGGGAPILSRLQISNVWN